MRIRSIKPEFWRSDDIKALDWQARLLFIGLWSYVDDNGVGIDDERLITADLFALEDNPTEVRATIRDGLATLSRGFLIARYEVDGKRYLYIVNWDKHQKIDKPAKARYPRPDNPQPPVIAGEEHESDPESSEPRESVATVSRLEQGNRGTEEQVKDSADKPPKRDSIPAALRASFDEFWNVYPRKTAKDEARRKFILAAKRADPQEIVTGARRFAIANRQTEQKFIAHPATWLHQGRWQDEVGAAAGPVKRPVGWEFGGA